MLRLAAAAAAAWHQSQHAKGLSSKLRNALMVDKNFHRKFPRFDCEEQIALLASSALDRMVRHHHPMFSGRC
jgi:hypothetical protein